MTLRSSITHEILSPLYEITARVPMTQHEFLTLDHKVQRSVFGSGAEATVVIVNTGATEWRHESQFGGSVVLPSYGFMIESRTFVAFCATQSNGENYTQPTNHDPQGHGQDLRLLLGKMLWLDVDRCDAGLSYAIPADNPFRGRTDGRPEIWAWGLREPWRFSFDPVTGDLWVGDLGQERGDEVAIVRRGENHGWNVYEGFELFSHQYQKEGVVYVPPIFSTRRKQGITMVGGYVFRAEPRSSFYGVYIFGDYASKRIWGMTQENRSLKTIRQLATSPQSITAFSVDGQGNFYVVGQQGMIYQLDFSNAMFDEPVKGSPLSTRQR